MEKTLTELIDELIIVHIKLYHVIDKKHDAADRGFMDEAGYQGVVEDTLNGQRSALKNAISFALGEKFNEIKVGSQEKLQR